MGELFKIQNDLLFTCKLITFIALMIAGLTIAIKLYQGQEVDVAIKSRERHQFLAFRPAWASPSANFPKAKARL